MRLTEAQYAELAGKGPGNITAVRAEDAPLMALTFELPWPPTVNTYWRHTVKGGKFKKARSKVLLSERGREYRGEACASMNRQRVPRGALKGRLAVYAVAYPPDKRQRDLDNLWKGVLDSLKHNGVIVDDGDIDDLHIVRGAQQPGGKLVLRVGEIAHDWIMENGSTFDARGDNAYLASAGTWRLP